MGICLALLQRRKRRVGDYYTNESKSLHQKFLMVLKLGICLALLQRRERRVDAHYANESKSLHQKFLMVLKLGLGSFTTYIIGYYNPSVRIIDLTSHTTTL